MARCWLPLCIVTQMVSQFVMKIDARYLVTHLLYHFHMPQLMLTVCSKFDFLPMDFISFEWMGVEHLIENLVKLSASVGVDAINSKFLRSTKLYLSILLATLFTQSLQDCTLPSDWKEGKAISLHKASTSHAAIHYRSLSLTSASCKLLEHDI